jgi:hypothetical protein
MVITAARYSQSGSCHPHKSLSVKKIGRYGSGYQRIYSPSGETQYRRLAGAVGEGIHALVVVCADDRLRAASVSRSGAVRGSIAYNKDAVKPAVRKYMTERKRPPLVIWIVLLLAALTGFYGVTQRPRFATYHTVDVVQLLGSGACFGATIVGIIVSIRRRN